MIWPQIIPLARHAAPSDANEQVWAELLLPRSQGQAAPGKARPLRASSVCQQVSRAAPSVPFIILAKNLIMSSGPNAKSPHPTAEYRLAEPVVPSVPRRRVGIRQEKGAAYPFAPLSACITSNCNTILKKYIFLTIVYFK